MPLGVRKPRVHARSTFSAGFAADELHARRGRLYLERGAWTRTTDKEGDVIADTKEPQRALVANIGDKLILAGPTIEETVVARVETVYPDGESMYVAITSGELAPSTKRVHVMKVALQPQQQKLKFRGRR
jgi:hypothetical protein